MDTLYTGDPANDAERIAWMMQLFQSARLQRVNFEVQWEESAALVWPEFRNSFAYGHVRPPGAKYSQYQVDSTGAIAAWRFMAIADAMVTPHNMLWSRVTIDNKDLLKERDVCLYLEEWTQLLWRERYKPEANFQAQQLLNWMCLGVFGNQYMLVDEYDPGPQRGPKGLRYIACAPGEIYLLVNHQGRVDGFVRHFRWTADQAYKRWKDAIPPVLKAALEKPDRFTLYDFLQFVVPRTDYDPRQIFSPQGKPWSSVYVSVAGYCILEESGYYEFPLPCGRYMQAPEEWYGRGPAQQVLPELKTKNAEKEAFLKQGQLAGDPAWMLPSDGLFDFKTQSGAFNYGAMSPDGKPLVGALPTGNIQITKELMEDSDRIISAAFLTDLFPMLFNPKEGSIQRSAREVIEVANQMGIFLAPTLGRQMGEYLGVMVPREMAILNRQGKAPKMPQVMREASGEFHIRYTSPLGRALSSQGIAGYMRSVEMASQIAQASGDESVFDAFDFDTAIPEMSDQQFAPAHWMASPQQLAQKRKDRARQARQEAQVKMLPGQAAIMKAQAINSKAQAGQNIGGTLSGVPRGQMPMVPGAPAGLPGQPGIGGRPGLPGRKARR